MPNTRDDYSQVAEIRECKDCGESFELTQQDVDYYELNHWTRPSRCPECRRHRRTTGANLRG